MTTTAQDIAGAFRDHLPGLRDRRLHALLYLAQGICLAANDRPLFPEPITATPTGVLVGLTGAAETVVDDNAAAVVRVVLARYGSLTGSDAEALIRGQTPWQQARAGSGRISTESLARWFHALDEDPDGTVSGIPRSARAQLRPLPRPGRATADSPEGIAAFITEVQTRG